MYYNHNVNCSFILNYKILKEFILLSSGLIGIPSNKCSSKSAVKKSLNLVQDLEKYKNRAILDWLFVF